MSFLTHGLHSTRDLTVYFYSQGLDITAGTVVLEKFAKGNWVGPYYLNKLAGILLYALLNVNETKYWTLVKTDTTYPPYISYISFGGKGQSRVWLFVQVFQNCSNYLQ